MSLLIQLRYRIKAIETIKKITHAMRLISMSARSRLKSKEEPLKNYIKTSGNLLARIHAHAPTWQNNILNPSANQTPKQLIILIGSQRGLCGNFNTTLFHYFESSLLSHLNKSTEHPVHCIAIGKKAINYVSHNERLKIVDQHPEITAKSIASIAHALTSFLFDQSQPYTQVQVVSNELKTFFIQKPHLTQLIPFATSQVSKDTTDNTDPYLWEQSPQEILDQLGKSTIESQLHYLLFESLLAEHAARFISMDNATRNAQTLLEETQLQYNKLRQAKITKELTELVSNI